MPHEQDNDIRHGYEILAPLLVITLFCKEVEGGQTCFHTQQKAPKMKGTSGVTESWEAPVPRTGGFQGGPEGVGQAGRVAQADEGQEEHDAGQD